MCRPGAAFKTGENRPHRPKPVKIGRSRTADSLRTYPAKAVRIAFTRIYFLRLTLNCIVIYLPLAHKPVLLWAVARGPVQQVQIEVVRAEALQRRVTVRFNVLWGHVAPTDSNVFKPTDALVSKLNNFGI